MRQIDWTPDGVDSLTEILDYYRDRAGENVANNIYGKIIKEHLYYLFWTGEEI